MASNLLRGSVRASVTTRGKIQVTHYRDNDEILPSNIVDSQFPEFIREEYPKIVDFAKAYYNYISGNTGIGNIYDMRDLDETTGQFIESLKKEYAYNTPRFSFLNDVEFIRAASKFYSSKGSEESYKFLFRIMFNDDVDIMYPSEQIFKPSTAKWVQQQSVKVSLLNGSVPATDFIGDFLTVRNAANESQLILVEDAVSISEFDNEFEILFETELVIDVNVDDVLVGENFLAKIIPTLESAVPLIPGQKFKVGQVIRFTTTTGSGGVGVVTVVDNNSGIKHIKMLQFGTAYLTNFYLSVAPDGVFTETTGSYVAGSGPTAADIYTVAQDATEGYLETGDILRTDYVLNDSPGAYPNYVEPGYHGTYVSEFNIRQVFVLDDDYSALLLCKVGAVAKYPGKHVDMTGFPSNASVLQDNNYYQDFSYVVKNKRNIKDYRDVMTNMVHPSGMKMFGDKSENLVFNTTSALMASTVAGTNDLNYNFRASAAASVEHYSMMLDFTRTSTLDSKITFSRTGTAASYYDETTVVKAEENLLTYSQEFDNAAWAKNGSVVTANTVVAPDGTSTAELVSETIDSFSHSVYQASNVTSGFAYTISVFVKKGGGATAPNIVQLAFGSTGFGTSQYANFNINTGVLATVAGGTATITSVGSGWYRITFTATATATSSSNNAAIVFTNNNDALGRVPFYAGTTTSDVYIWGAQLEQRSSVTAYTPTTTTAITNYIRPLQYAAANVARIDYDPTVISQQNLLTYSEQFDNASWAKNQATVTSNAVTAPDGTLTADKLVESTSNSIHYVASPAVPIISGNPYTLSYIAKSAGRTRFSIFCDGSLNTALAGTGQCFDLSTGTVVNTLSGVTASIYNLGDGWYRCVAVVNSSLTTGVTPSYAFLISSGTTTTYTGNGTSGIYIWGAQINTGATALPYLQTTTAAKTLYAPKGLLIEETRTNRFTYSEQFDNAAWVKGAVNIETNSIISPDGTLSADKLIATNTTAVHGVNSGSVISPSTTYSVSFYAKAAEESVIYFAVDVSGAIAFNLLTGVATSAEYQATSGMTYVGNGWYKCYSTFLTSASTATIASFRLRNNGTFLGNNYGGLYLWGAQLELGAFPTSYIPTTASQLTRNADVASMTGTNFSSWYNQTSGTWVAEFQGGRESTQGFYGRVIGYGGSATILATEGSTTNIGTWDGTISVMKNVTGADYFVTGGKAAVAYDSSGRTITGNGYTPASGGNNFPTISSISLGSNAGPTNMLNGHIKKIVYYPTRLSNARLQALTT